MLNKFHKLLLIIVLLPLSFAVASGQEAAAGQGVLGINIASGHHDDGPVEGVIVVGVTPGGPADAAGLMASDVLIALDDVALTAGSVQAANNRLMTLMSHTGPGEALTIQYLRDGDVLSTQLVVGALDPDMVPPGFPFMRDLERLSRRLETDIIEPLEFRWRHYGAFGGMELVSLSPELGRYFGTEEGLLVIRAPDGDAIELEDGDVIRRIGARTPADPAHAMRILRSYEPGEELIIEIMRQKKSREVRVTLPEREARTGHWWDQWSPPGNS